MDELQAEWREKYWELYEQYFNLLVIYRISQQEK